MSGTYPGNSCEAGRPVSAAPGSAKILSQTPKVTPSIPESWSLRLPHPRAMASGLLTEPPRQLDSHSAAHHSLIHPATWRSHNVLTIIAEVTEAVVVGVVKYRLIINTTKRWIHESFRANTQGA